MERMSSQFLDATRKAAKQLSKKTTTVVLGDIFSGCFVTFETDKDVLRTFNSKEFLGEDGPDIFLVCEDLLGGKVSKES